MSPAAQLPNGIHRDATIQGPLYYTQEQLIAYGQRCADENMKKIDRSRMRSNASGQPPAEESLGQLGRGGV